MGGWWALKGEGGGGVRSALRAPVCAICPPTAALMIFQPRDGDYTSEISQKTTITSISDADHIRKKNTPGELSWDSFIDQLTARYLG